MPSILILNTTLDRACALVSRDADSIVGHAFEARQSAQTILQLAGKALNEAGLKRADAVAVVAGPGSFTGTRIGVAVAQGLCAAWDVPAAPISSLALTAAAARRLHDAEAYLVGLASKADELYFGCYLEAGDGLELRGAEQAGALENLRLESVATRDLLAAGDGWVNAGAIEKQFGVRLKSEPVTVAVEDIDLATMARTMWERGQFVDGDLLRPNYISEGPQYREQSDSG